LTKINLKKREKPDCEKSQKQRLKAKLEWIVECDKSFKSLQQKLVEDPILVHFDPNLECIVHTDACNKASGGILTQKHDNKEHVIAYTSRIFNQSEQRYTTSEKECQAIVDALKKFRSYLIGGHFKVITDHIAIISVFKLKDPHGKLMRMRLMMQSYDMEILFRKGKVHTNVDAMSRLIDANYEIKPLEQLQIDFNGEVGMAAYALISEAVEADLDEPNNAINYSDIFSDNHLLHYVKLGKHLSTTTNKQVKRTEQLAQHYVYLNPTIYYRTDINQPLFPYIVPPISVRPELIQTAHVLGHFHSNTLTNAIHAYVMNQKLNFTIKTAGHTISIDLIGPLPESKRYNKYICCITEYVTKNAFAVPLKSKTAEDTAEALWFYISIYGPPKTLISDQGTEFLNSTIRQLTMTCGIDHKITSPYHPNTNGLVERFNQTLIRALKKHCEDDIEEWDR
jgi:hypothetical protein